MPEQLAHAARIYRHYSKALYPALRNDPFYATLERSAEGEGTRAEAMLTYYDYSIHEAETYGHIVCPQDLPFGASIWAVPIDDARIAQKTKDKRAVMLAKMGQDCWETYQAINDSMAKGTQTVTSTADWYLSILGIQPELQGQGLGAELLWPVLKRADAAGVATFLETFTPRNMRFYERFGYAEAGQFFESLTQSNYHVMRRLPGAG